MKYGIMPHDEMRKELSLFLSRQPNAPFLFVGSGISQRYLGTETWSDLLELFCAQLKQPFRYYEGRCAGSLPRLASFMATDYYQWWWTNQPDDYKSQFAGWCHAESDPLKIDISQYMRSKVANKTDDPALLEELEVLKSVRVAGIITTNWDGLLEELFPDYKVFVGQSEMITGRVHGMGEIYKIHGSYELPSTLVLTEDDYEDFNRRKAYMASKLMTIFVEHPIIFMGYSLGDDNIQQMLRTVAEGMEKDELELLRDNLIFIRRPRSTDDPALSYITESSFSSHGYSIGITEIFTGQFKTIYEILADNSLKLPPKVLRFCKEQIYDLVMAKDPKERLHVTSIENIDKLSDLSFVVGVGATPADYAEKGFQQINVYDLAKEVLLDESNLPWDRVMEMLNNTAISQFVPIFKYLKQSGMSKDEALTAYPRHKRRIEEPPQLFFSPGYKKRYENNWQGKTTQEIIEGNEPQVALILIMFQSKDEVDTRILREFLTDNIEKVKTNESYSSVHRKALSYYDWVVNCPWHN